MGYYFPNQGSNSGLGPGNERVGVLNSLTTREFPDTTFLEGPGKEARKPEKCERTGRTSGCLCSGLGEGGVGGKLAPWQHQGGQDVEEAFLLCISVKPPAS